MDASEYEGDIQLQKAASGLLADFKTSLPSFLRRTLEDGKLRLRRRVRVKEKDRLLRLLAPFQELPQLLDPHLEKFLPALGEAYLESLQGASTTKKPLKDVALLVPLSAAICELLYTFCKIRGEKVVVRFLNAEARNLELLLSAVEAAEMTVSDSATGNHTNSGHPPWAWEERYICLLWLSHLLLAPFDLATISSASMATDEIPGIPGLEWPENLPGVALRVVPLAVRYLAKAGKERDAAKMLLVRLSMRRDMQELGLLHALVQWALESLKPSASTIEVSTYHSIGVLSFLSGLLVSSASTSDMRPYLARIFGAVKSICEDVNPAFTSIRSSALARKVTIKIMRAITVLNLHFKTPLPKSDMERTEIVEASISYTLEALADNDTPVRLAASKALSIITLSLPPVMATQVIEAVLESLTHNVLWANDSNGEFQGKTRDLSAVNPLEWHGLILTLSHLLYRRSPPLECLSEILDALLVGLSFERRSTSGSSIGTNVRDAACFGIWALARRYGTAEMGKVPIPSSYALRQRNSSLSVIQILATELVVSASLDPAGNIRRGASAALQELIGRHPDTIAEGIAVVQVVDYHAVALRSRAMLEVAPKAALLSNFYQDALLGAFLSWRGTGDGNPTSRRNAASGIGQLARGFQLEEMPFQWDTLISLMTRIKSQLDSLSHRESDQRHGLLLSMAAVISSIPDVVRNDSLENAFASPIARETIILVSQIVIAILETAKSFTDRRIELVAEGVSRVILAIASMLPIHNHFQTLINAPAQQHIEDGKHGYNPQERLVTLGQELLMIWLRQTESEVVDAATEAAASLMLAVDLQQRNIFAGQCISELLEVGRGRLLPGYIFALAAVFSIIDAQQQEKVCNAILRRWETASDIESKIFMLQSLTRGSLFESNSSVFVNLIAEGLDDYTTDGRGDVGSLVRVEALKSTRKAFQSISWESMKAENDGLKPWFGQLDTFSILYGKVLRLAAEKLDRVRIEAQQTLAQVCLHEAERQRFEHFTISSFDYFCWLLELQVHNWLSIPFFQYKPSQWCLDLFEGLVSSADTGSEDLIRVSRAAIAAFCDRLTPRGENLCDPINLKDFVCGSVVEVAKRNISNDRVLIPTLEVMSFLFDAGIMQQSNVQWRPLYLLVQRAHYKTGNVRKIEAAIKVYGGLLQVHPEALEKLTSMLLHPFPKIRNQVADVLFVVRGVGKGVNWMKAGKEDLRKLKEELRNQV